MTVDIATLAIRIDSLEARTAARDMDRMRDAGSRAEQSTSSLEAATRKLQGALAMLGIGAGLGSIIRMADEYTKFTAQLRLATQSQREYAAAVDDVRRIANTAQQDLAATGVLYARIANGTRELGVTQQQVAKITEVVNLALKVSGATASESASAMLQLSQSFASGTLRGEEFNAVNEAAPRLMKALADNMGVPIGALKKMAEEGAITSKVMANALPQALQQLQEESKQVQTISGAFTVLKNKVMELTAVKAEANGMVGLLTGGISLLADSLHVITAALSGLMAIKVAGYFVAGAAAVQAYFAANAELAALVVAEHASLVARAQAIVASTAVTAAGTAAKLVETEAVLAGLVAQKAEIIAIRESAVAQLTQARSSIASAEAAIAAASAAGAQSYALRVLRLATAELAVAETARVAAMAELTALGIAQTRVTAQITAATAAQTAASAANAAATAAQTAAQAGLAGAAARTATSAGVLTTALRFLGGPIGIITGLLGLGVTAWMIWGGKSKEASKEAAESFDEAHARIIKGLDEQIAKNEKLIQLQNGGVSKSKAERDLPIVEQLSKASKLLDDINSRSGDFAAGKGKSNEDVIFAREKVLKNIVELTEKMNKRDATDALAKEGTEAQKLAKFFGENGSAAQKLAYELEKVRKEYGMLTPAMEAAVRAKYVDKDGAATAKADVAARVEAIKSGIEHERNLRTEGVARVAELNRQGLAGDAEVYSAKHAAALAAGKDAAAVFNAEIAALSAYNGKDAAARIANNAKIKDLGAQRTEALRAASVAAEQLRTAYEYDKDKPARDAAAASQKEIVAINDQIDATDRQIAAYNKLPSVITMATVALLEEQKAALSGIEGSEKAVADIDTKIAAYSRLAQAQKSLQGLETGTDVAKAEQLLKILQAVDDAARQAAQGMTDSFGRVGTAIGGLTTALTGYAVQQQAIAAQLAAVKADPKSDAQKIAQAEIAASRASAQAQIKSYGDMASSAKGFFSENSKGYKVLEATEKAFRAYEMALALESMAKKIFFKEGEVAANVALNTTKLTGEAASTAASTGLAATEASAWGITAVVKAIASLPFPLNLAAGAATLAAVVAIGAKVMGSVGSGQSASQQRQDTAGTGSILGDSSAKSESIARAIALTAENSNIELSHTAAMVASLRNIESSISGLSSLLLRTTDLSGDVPVGGYSSTTKALNSDGANAAAGFAYGTLVGGPVLGVVAGLASVALNKLLGSTGEKITNAIFGGKTTAQDTGLYVSTTTLGNLVTGGANVNQYTDIKKDGGLFGSDKYSTTHTQLGAEINAQFSQVFAGMYDAVVAGADLLGVGGDEFKDRLYKLVVSIPEISTKGLTGEEIQKQLETVFSKVGDDIARSGVDGLSQFQKVGEGYLETLTRVASNYANLDSILASSGTTFGQTGMASIAARERLIALTGGIDKLASQQSGFNDNFLTQAERLAPVQKYVTDQLGAMGLQSLDTRDKFKDYVLGLANGGALATESGAKQYAALMALSEAFAKTHAATVDLTKSEQEIADERIDLQNQLDQLTMTQEQLAAKARTAIDGHNLSLYDQVIAAQKAKDAVAEANSILDIQGQIAAANGDKVAAAAVLEKQHLAALVDMSPALAEANKQLWAAQATQKLVTEATTEHNAILSQLAALYAATGDKAAAAAVLEQQHQAALVGLSPALAAATQATWAAQAAEQAKKEALAESNSILALQAQMYAATGDKAGAAAVLEQQRAAALVGLSQAVVDATKATWAAQDAEKERATALTISNGILSNQAAMYEATGDKAGAALVAQKQWQAALAAMDPALRESAAAAHQAQLAEKDRNAAISNRNAVLDQQAKYYETTNNTVMAAYVLEQQRTASLAGQTQEVIYWTRAAWAAEDAEKARTKALTEANTILDLQAQMYAANGNTAGAALVLEQQRANALIGLSPAVAAATKAMWEAKDAAEAKKRIDDLNLELLNAQGKSQEALNVQRRAELAALSATEQAIKQATYAAIDKAKTDSLKLELLGAQGQDAEVKRLQRLAELATLSAGDQEIKKAIYAAQDKAEADKKAADMAQQFAQAQQQAAEQAKSAAEALTKAWQSATDSIMDEVKRIRGLIDGGGTQSYAAAQSAFAIATGQARAGDQDAAKLLPGLSKAMLDLAEANAVTAFDLRLARAQAAASLTQTGNMLASQFGLTLPSFDVGTDYISQTGLALVHEGEKITPAASNRPYTEQSSTSDDEVRALRAEVVELRGVLERGLYQIARNTSDSKDVLENAANGYVPLVVAVPGVVKTKEEATA